MVKAQDGNRETLLPLSYSEGERLFCCECGNEVKPGATARVVPALQPGSNQSSSPRPHVWCARCLREEVAEAMARPKPHAFECEPAYHLHRFIWSVGEGRTDEELRRFHFDTLEVQVADRWEAPLGTLLRKLTEAGKIERRGDRRVALCTPWGEPPGRDVPASVTCQVCGKSYADPACSHMNPRCSTCSDDCEEVAECSTDELPTPEELQADRYPIDPNDDRLMMIEKLLRKVLERLDHLVCMDNEKG